MGFFGPIAEPTNHGFLSIASRCDGRVLWSFLDHFDVGCAITFRGPGKWDDRRPVSASVAVLSQSQHRELAENLLSSADSSRATLALA
jgi:hypothetical protein